MTLYVKVDGSEIVATAEISTEQVVALLAAYPSPLDGWIASAVPVSNATHYYAAPDFIAYTAPQAAAKAAAPLDYEAAWSNVTFAWSDVTALAVRISDAVRALRAVQQTISVRQGLALGRVTLAVLASAAPDTADTDILDEAATFSADIEAAIAAVTASTTVGDVATNEAVTEPTSAWWTLA